MTKCNRRDPQSDDLVQRDFTARKPGVKYLCDITQIKCADGRRLYLAAMMDCYDGAVVGFSMKHHMRAILCCGGNPKFCVTAKSGANRVKFIMGGRREKRLPPC